MLRRVLLKEGPTFLLTLECHPCAGTNGFDRPFSQYAIAAFEHTCLIGPVRALGVASVRVV